MVDQDLKPLALARTAQIAWIAGRGPLLQTSFLLMSPPTVLAGPQAGAARHHTHGDAGRGKHLLATQDRLLDTEALATTTMRKAAHLGRQGTSSPFGMMVPYARLLAWSLPR